MDAVTLGAADCLPVFTRKRGWSPARARARGQSCARQRFARRVAAARPFECWPYGRIKFFGAHLEIQAGKGISGQGAVHGQHCRPCACGTGCVTAGVAASLGSRRPVMCRHHGWVTAAAAVCVLALCAHHAAGRGANAVHLPLDLRPPRRAAVGARDARGFPAQTTLFEFDEAAPLSRLERIRWQALRASSLDRAWRTSRTEPSPLRVTERYNTVDLLGGITRVGEYYTMIRIGGQRVRVQVDVRVPRLCSRRRRSACAGCTPVEALSLFHRISDHLRPFPLRRRDQARSRFLLQNAQTVRCRICGTTSSAAPTRPRTSCPAPTACALRTSVHLTRAPAALRRTLAARVRTRPAAASSSSMATARSRGAPS